MPNKDFQNGLIVALASGVTIAEGGNIGYQVKFKVDGEDYYIASCKQGESISKPPIGVELGVWQDAQGNNISFPYTPNADIELYNTYRQVEYIEVTSMGAYINTGTPHTSNAYWEIECNYTSSPSNNYALFGASYQYGEYTINLYNSAPYICAGTGGGGNKAAIPEPLVRHKYTANNSGLYADDVLLSSNVVWNNNPNINYYIFAMNYNGTTYSTANARVYSCKIWNGDTLVRNFVPCYRKADNEIGMYDLVTETFFTNAGTGSFSKGADV